MTQWRVWFTCGLLLIALRSAISQPPQGEALPAPAIERGIIFGEVAGQVLRLDMARPHGAGPWPAIIAIHGGGWSKGSRAALHPFIEFFARNGYVAVTIDYRLSPAHRFPAHVEDCKAAVRFLRAHAGQYVLKPDRIGALGFSAGGHLALMLAATGPQSQMEGDGPWLDQSSGVQAAVNYFGAVNFRTWRLPEEGQRRVRRNFNGQSFEEVLAGIFGRYDPHDPVMLRASPVTHLDAQDPPMLTFQGSEDPMVPLSQAREFDEAARQAGARHRLVVLEGQDHGWTGPVLEQTLQQTLAFFDDHLKLKAGPPEPAGAVKDSK